MLVKKAITSGTYEIPVLLDMSKAFDKEDRGMFFENLKEVLDHDELRISTLLKNVYLTVRIKKKRNIGWLGHLLR